MNVVDITYPDITNGNGVRATIWFAGCIHNCPGCHNPQTHDFNNGHSFNDKVINDIYEIAALDYIDGITLSGGDPLCLSNEDLYKLSDFIDEFKQKTGKNVWLYTGYYLDDLINTDTARAQLQYDVASKCDVVVDGPFEIDKRSWTTPFRGSTNQNLIYIEHDK